jgi:hypothetical protein
LPAARQASTDITRIKAGVRERDGMRCVECSMTDARHRQIFGRAIEVHRVNPGSEYSTEPGVCVTLCKDCHAGKPVSRPHTSGKTRHPVALPTEWFSLLKRMAKKDGRAITWQLILAIKAEAERQGITDLPVPPWETPTRSLPAAAEPA